jgi:hypothetical protein
MAQIIGTGGGGLTPPGYRESSFTGWLLSPRPTPQYIFLPLLALSVVGGLYKQSDVERSIKEKYHVYTQAAVGITCVPHYSVHDHNQ